MFLIQWFFNKITGKKMEIQYFNRKKGILEIERLLKNGRKIKSLWN